MRATVAAFLFAVLATPVLATPALAQPARFELSPFAGYRWGGEIDRRDTDLFDEDVEVDQSAAFGVRLEIGVTPNWAIEVLGTRQSTELTSGDEGLFGEDRGLADITLDTLQVGLVFQGSSGQLRPYGVASLGGTRLDTDLPGASTEERFSASAGGGVKLFVNRNLGFRFEGRFYWIDTEDDECCRRDHDDWSWGENGDLTQGEATAGVILAF
jgi:hypothetical protein